MELFLLLSMGLALVAFISVALNQPPTASFQSDSDSTIPLDYALLNSENIPVLKLEDQKIEHNFESNDPEKETSISSENISVAEDKLIVAVAS